METVTDFLFLGSKITADVDCSNGIKRHLFLGKKVMRNLEIVLKSRDIVRVEQERKLSVEELLLLNCSVGKHF